MAFLSRLFSDDVFFSNDVQENKVDEVAEQRGCRELTGHITEPLTIR